MSVAAGCPCPIVGPSMLPAVAGYGRHPSSRTVRDDDDDVVVGAADAVVECVRKC